MSRQRAHTDPFWATAITRMDSGVAGIVRQLWEVVKRSPSLAPYLWMGSGWRTSSTEHASGMAIDIVITPRTGVTPTSAERAAGNLMVQWLIANRGALGLRGIIFSRDGKARPEIYGYSRPGVWRSQANRGSISANHVDHIHAIFWAGARWPSALNGAVVGGAPSKPTPGLPGSGADGPTTGGLTMSEAKEIRDAIQSLATQMHQFAERMSINTQTIADLQLRRAREVVESVLAGQAAHRDELAGIRAQLVEGGMPEADVDELIARTEAAAEAGATKAIESVPVTRVQIVESDAVLED